MNIFDKTAEKTVKDINSGSLILSDGLELPVERICRSDNWTGVQDDPSPRAVRWAIRELRRTMSPDWTAWHYTEGNGVFTACGAPVIPFVVDGSPMEGEVDRVTCRRCMSKMRSVELISGSY